MTKAYRNLLLVFHQIDLTYVEECLRAGRLEIVSLYARRLPVEQS